MNAASARLGSPFTEGLRGTWWNTSEIVLYDRNINHCTGCKSCWTKTPGQCVQADDMTQIVELLRQAQLLVFATPLYFFTVPGMVKDFIDRQLALNYGSYLKAMGKLPLDSIVWPETCKIILISPCGFPGLSNFDALELMMKKIYGKAYVEALLLPSANPVSRDWDSSQFTELYDTMRDLGRDFGNDGAFSEPAWNKFVAISTELDRSNFARFAGLSKNRI